MDPRNVQKSIHFNYILIIICTCNFFHFVDCSPFHLGGHNDEPNCTMYGKLQLVEGKTTYSLGPDVRFFSVECTADYPLDFSFDGIEPRGQEFALHFDTTVQILNYTSYHLTHGLHLSLTANLEYSQLTGNYSIFSRANPSLSTTFYVFHEKSAHLFRTSSEEFIVVSSKDEIIHIPCRSTVFNSNVTLHRLQVESRKIELLSSKFLQYDGKTGFNWNLTGFPAIIGNSVEYYCRNKRLFADVMYIARGIILEDSLKYILTTTTVESSVDEKENGGFRPIIQISVFEGLTNIECSTAGIGYFGNVKARNSKELSLRMGCAVKTQSCSFKRVGSSSLKGDRVQLEFAYPNGLAYCTDELNSLTTTKEYFRGLDDKVYFNWEDARDSNALLKITTLNGSTPVYSNMTYSFVCSFQDFIMTHQIIFTLYFMNGTTTYHISPNNRHNRRPPDFEVQETSETLSLNSTNQQLKCVAIGDELPTIAWEKDGKEINDTNVETLHRPGYSYLSFKLVKREHGGEYKCLATNSVGTASKSFHVNVVDPHQTNYGLVIGLPIGLIVILVITIFISYGFFRNFYKNRLGLTSEEIEAFKNGTTMSDDPAKHLENIQCGAYNTAYEIPSNEFQLDKSAILGSGQFGIVFKGLYQHSPIAVKTVRPQAEPTYLKALLSELKVMIYINGHKNIVNLLGANTASLRKGLVYVFVELCSLGSLEGYLRNRQNNFVNQITREDGIEIDPMKYINITLSTETIFTRDLILWSNQIASAMDYLDNKKVIHGDLATRNVLLANRETAKITDFGLARKLYDYSVYQKKNQEPLPWRWMAIESLRSLTFSTKSDVWSFGVTLWEIFALGDVPFPGLSWSVDFVQQLQNNLRMTQPKYACTGIYNTMLDCWQNEPEDRPCFKSLTQYFSNYLSKFPSVESSSDKNISLNNYENVPI